MGQGRVLIVGSQGFVGSWIFRHLWEKGWEVYGVLSPGGQSSWRLPKELKKRIFLRLPTQLVKQLRWDGIIFTASYGQYHHQHQDEGFLRNLTDLVHISRQALNHSTWLIFLGTGAEYAPQLDGGFESQIFQGIWPTSYLWLKRAQYHWLQSLKRQGLKFCYLRLFHVFGPLEDPQRWTNGLLRAIFFHEPVTVSDPTISRDLIHVQDVALAIETILRNPSPEIFDGYPININGGHPVTLGEMVQWVNQRFPQVKTQTQPHLRPWDQAHQAWWGHTYRRQKLLPNWQPENWPRGFEKTITFYHQNPCYLKYLKPHPMAGPRPLIRVILPCFQDGPYLANHLPRWLETVFQRNWWVEFWILCDNDPDSYRQLQTLAKNHVNIRLFLTTETWGSQRLIAFGVCYQNEAVKAFVTMDTDGQDPWAMAAWMIHRFVRQGWGYQMVTYPDRDESFWLLQGRRLFYSLWSLWSKIPIIPHHVNFTLVAAEYLQPWQHQLSKAAKKDCFFWRSWRYQNLVETAKIHPIKRPASWRPSHHRFRDLLNWAVGLWTSVEFRWYWAWLYALGRWLLARVSPIKGLSAPQKFEFWEYNPVTRENEQSQWS